MGFVIRLQITLKKQLILCESVYQLTEHLFFYLKLETDQTVISQKSGYHPHNIHSIYLVDCWLW